MGIIWRFTMVLLSTLAALVIIVHSAEEEYEAEYRRELRPERMLDTGRPRYEQPWRTMELEPALRSSTPIDKWLDSSSEEPIRRRRRKRKRRPDTSSAEDLVEPERYGYPEEHLRPYFDVDSSTEREISETTIRRKKLEPRPKRREENRPIRRRVQKRKRPSVETWPELSEFSDYRPSKASRDEDKPEVTGRIDSDSIVSEYTHFDGRGDNIREPFEQQSENYREYEETDLKSSDDQDTSYDRSPDDQKQHQISSLGTKKEDFDSVRPEMKEDKSLSEFTIEDMNSYQVPYTEEERKTTREKINDKSPGFFREMIKADDKGPINPLTLKDILKKSNGSSLSEILQQHNLSLADLLHGREQAVSILKSEDTFESQQSTSSPPAEFMFIDKTSPEEKESSEGKLLLNSETKYDTDTVSEIPTTTKSMHNVQEDTKPEEVETTTSAKVEEAPKQANIRRFPAGIRRKQRIRPMMNNTYKSQLSRDMLALNARKYSLNYRRRNSTKDWKDHIPMMKKNITNNEDTIKTVEIETTTLTVVIEETTIAQDFENCTKAAEPENLQASSSDRVPEIRDEKFENETISEKGIEIPKLVVNDAEKPKVISTTLQPVNVSGLRRQAFNNRLKKKRLKQKNLTTEPPQDDIMLNLFGIPNLVSSSEFIERTQGPKTSLDDVTILDDFITTEVPRKYRNRTKSVRYSTPRSVTTSKFTLPPTTTEESAKIEIEEIFNDSQTSARLSRILMERNMTLSELVEHRERGSSHVHLADIFHNASKEPNPAEPFLSKSSIEPISKETYPLRALLDANLYDTTTKSSTIDPVPVQNTDVNIPVVMNFGNNVNENAESMGIMSLFHNITKNETDIDKSTIMKDSQGTPYQTSITIVNTTDVHNGSDTARESRVIHVLNDNQDDIVSWNEIFSLMRRNYANQTEEDVLGNGLIPAETIKKSSLEEDVDGDGLIVLEDLQHLNDLESKIASTSNENINFNTHERNDPTKPHGASDKASSRTKSVTIATASIAGLAMILFLLTYVGYKWQQQRSMARRKSFSGERIPTPVFENRKGHKNNSSTRSISPMLSSSNIYTLNTLDSRNGKESPDYMWDSLRKPFQ